MGGPGNGHRGIRFILSLGRAGIHLSSSSSDYFSDRVSLPFWAAAAISAAALGAWIVAGMRRRGQSSRDNHCQRCGYDLRATPDRCPQCGTSGPERPEGPVEGPRNPPACLSADLRSVSSIGYAHTSRVRLELLSCAAVPNIRELCGSGKREVVLLGASQS
jgi:hypothetical protein